MEDFVIARNPEADSSLPYLVRLPLGPDGVVLTGFRHTRATRLLLKRSGVPVVETWNLGPAPIDMAVGFSNFEAAREATHYLIRCGRKRLAYAGGTQTDNDRTEAREAGFRAALAEARIAVHEDWIWSLPMEFSSGVELATRIARLKHRPDGIFAASDVIAAGFILESRRVGLDVPRDIAVVGFDDAPMAAVIEPRLTTIHVPQREIGRVAADMVLARLTGNAAGLRQHDVGFQLVARTSTSPALAGGEEER